MFFQLFFECSESASKHMCARKRNPQIVMHHNSLVTRIVKSWLGKNGLCEGRAESQRKCVHKDETHKLWCTWVQLVCDTNRKELVGKKRSVWRSCRISTEILQKVFNALCSLIIIFLFLHSAGLLSLMRLSLSVTYNQQPRLCCRYVVVNFSHMWEILGWRCQSLTGEVCLIFTTSRVFSPYPLLNWGTHGGQKNSWQKRIQLWTKCHRQCQNTLTEY